MARPEAAARGWHRQVLVGVVLTALMCGAVVTDALGVRSGTLPRSLALPAWLDPTGQDSNPAVDAAAEQAAAARATPPPDVGEAEAATPPESHQAALVDAEDQRISQIVSDHHSRRVPFVVPGVAGSLPTEVLTPRAQPYDLPALLGIGAVTRLGDGSWLLNRSLIVVRGAQLLIEAPGATVRLASGPGGFASIIAFKSVVALGGGAGAPLTITSWDQAASAPDTETGDGRAYLRAVGSRMDLTEVHLSDVGFWSGRTGGLAWTGDTAEPATGSITGAVVERSHYGIFSLRSTNLTVTDSVLRANDVDGLLARRDTTGLTIRGVTASDNGRNGVSIVDGATHVTLTGGAATGNRVDGIRVDGRSRSAAQPGVVGSGYVVTGCAVTGNQAVGILVTAADGVALRDNRISGGQDGAVVHEVVGTPQITGNVVDAADFGVSVRGGRAGSAATVSRNRIGSALTGMQVQDATADVHDNVVAGATRYAVSLVGQVGSTRVVTNTLGGHGLAALDVARLAPGVTPAVDGNDDSRWTRDIDYLRYSGDYIETHPLVLLWALFLAIPIAMRLRSLRRRRDPGAGPGHPHRPGGRGPTDPPTMARTPMTAAVARRSDLAVVRSPSPPEPGALDATAMLPVTKVTVVSQTRVSARSGAGQRARGES